MDRGNTPNLLVEFRTNHKTGNRFPTKKTRQTLAEALSKVRPRSRRAEEGGNVSPFRAEFYVYLRKYLEERDEMGLYTDAKSWNEYIRPLAEKYGWHEGVDSCKTCRGTGKFGGVPCQLCAGKPVRSSTPAEFVLFRLSQERVSTGIKASYKRREKNDESVGEAFLREEKERKLLGTMKDKDQQLGFLLGGTELPTVPIQYSTPITKHRESAAQSAEARRIRDAYASKVIDEKTKDSLLQSIGSDDPNRPRLRDFVKGGRPKNLVDREERVE